MHVLVLVFGQMSTVWLLGNLFEGYTRLVVKIHGLLFRDCSDLLALGLEVARVVDQYIHRSRDGANQSLHVIV